MHEMMPVLFVTIVEAYLKDVLIYAAGIDASLMDRTDPLHLLLDHGRGCPRRRRAGDVVEEVLQQLCPVRRMHDFRVELHAVKPYAPVLECRNGRRR